MDAALVVFRVPGSARVPLAGVLSGNPEMMAKEAVDVLLIALAKAELTIDDETARDWYVAQRERKWSPFLADALKILERTMRPEDEEAAEAANRDDEPGESLPKAAE